MVIFRQVQPQKASSIELYRQILAVVALVPEGYVATYGQIAKLADYLNMLDWLELF